MAPKVNCNPIKLSNIVTYLQKSRTAHSIKELEKHLPSIASINSMQVKDYIQSLTDENRINVEKIGSGNWYWSFASQDLRLRERALAEAKVGRERASVTVEELKAKLLQVRTLREDEEAVLDLPGERREDLLAKQVELGEGIESLRREIEAFRDNDPTEVERKVKDTREARERAEMLTDEIYSMEAWFMKQGLDAESMRNFGQAFYGDEFDSEEGMLREL
ncbi:Hypothetical protein R9X50_00671300 [Acrodontium crateriforme]|uniref:Meiotic nuclear division protein 1 n=1 Tax=Acrodontium crateriforme TaxID=150365 RepID=A0AAQ3MA53_9PEZI|nr:Hypothetical protein R9X50_00671300 [Acrodontium crateriforme]